MLVTVVKSLKFHFFLYYFCSWQSKTSIYNTTEWLRMTLYFTKVLFCPSPLPILLIKCSIHINGKISFIVSFFNILSSVFKMGLVKMLQHISPFLLGNNKPVIRLWHLLSVVVVHPYCGGECHGKQWLDFTTWVAWPLLCYIE